MVEPEPKRRRAGGVRQRLAAAEAELRNNVDSSFLAEYLIEQYAWGEMTPQQVQALAMCGVRDMERAAPGVSCPPLEVLSKLGNSGRRPNKCRQELLRRVEPNVRLPPAATAVFPFKPPLNDKAQKALLPHETFAALYSDYHEAWEANVVPGEHKVSEFWAAMENHPQMDGRPLRSRETFRTKCIPCRVAWR